MVATGKPVQNPAYRPADEFEAPVAGNAAAGVAIPDLPLNVYTCIYLRMPIARTKTFRSGNSQAVRLPREVAFEDGVDLVIVRSGDVMTIYPEKKRSVAEMLELLRTLPRPSTIEVRDTEEIPEPEGL